MSDGAPYHCTQGKIDRWRKVKLNHFSRKNRSKGYWSLIQRNGGVLKTNKGGQEYEISAGTHISQFSTVLVHCEAYSVLWSGGTL